MSKHHRARRFRLTAHAVGGNAIEKFFMPEEESAERFANSGIIDSFEISENTALSKPRFPNATPT
ncbi:hypothetical protein [Dyadobacter sandarakinus]|uniref:Uncharacterized protein n=1 Tax=Dyadobacter sandarakinus TaxID=2747268 RepID=A0ABX7I7J5_9BACT|nr:hypothetical protein [Dyadobacter sandarakinus]QRR01452.1 hypothetical protein HWI92_11330 [Dyadobacter sandarakinus]